MAQHTDRTAGSGAVGVVIGMVLMFVLLAVAYGIWKTSPVLGLICFILAAVVLASAW